MKRERNTDIRFKEPATKLAIQHTITNSGRKQKHWCCSNNSSIATHRAAAATAAAAAAAAALCMHVRLTSRFLRRHLNHHRTYMFTRVTKYMAPTKKKKTRYPRFEPPTLSQQGQRPTCFPALFLVYIDRDRYVAIRTNRRLENLTKRRKQNPLLGNDASTAAAAPSRV